MARPRAAVRRGVMTSRTFKKLRDSACIASMLALGAACGHSEAARAPDRPHEHGAEHRAHHHHHRFDDAASWSKVFDDPTRDEWQRPKDVVQAMSITPGTKVADVGAGTGYFEPYLSRAVGPTGKVIAVDVEPDMVRWIEDRAKREGLANVQAVLGAPDDPKLAAASVDRVLVVDTWHHVEDRRAYARKLASALAPGGAVYIVDFTKESPHGPPPAARLTPEEVSADLASAGLSPRRIDAGLPYQYVIAADRPSTL